MKFETLHENLRLEILRRIERGLLTGSTLARATNFQQAHISNFLNRKRSLSLEGLDRVLAAQKLSVIDLLPPDSLPAIPAFYGKRLISSDHRRRNSYRCVVLRSHSNARNHRYH